MHLPKEIACLQANTITRSNLHRLLQVRNASNYQKKHTHMREISRASFCIRNPTALSKSFQADCANWSRVRRRSTSASQTYKHSTPHPTNHSNDNDDTNHITPPTCNLFSFWPYASCFTTRSRYQLGALRRSSAASSFKLSCTNNITRNNDADNNT